MLLFCFGSAGQLAARTPSAPNDRNQASDASNKSTEQDVVVTGKLTKAGLPQHLQIEPDLARGRARHQARAEQFVRCMQFLDIDLLHEAIDGPPQYSSTRFALGRLIQKNQACYPDLPLVPPREAHDLGDCNPATVSGAVNELWTVKECRAPYDRAALLRRVIAMYAGDLALTRAQTTDPAVQARFNAREVERNRFRTGDDKTMFEIAVCMVRLQPNAAVRLIEAQTTDEQYRLEDMIVRGSNDCIGGTNKLGLDPSEFRDYVTDAVYRWVVAARNVNSLIPAQK